MSAPVSTSRPLTVLLIDDQPHVHELVRLMLKDERDVNLYYCQEGARAVETAREVAPTVILQDLVMPDIDGLTLVRQLREDPATREVPLVVLSTEEDPVVKAEAFARGANDYLVKPPYRVELIARLRYHSQAYIHWLERNEAYHRLELRERQLEEGVAQAARYVRSLLPAPLRGAVTIDWRFVPCTALGGDAFGYYWLDPDHLALYLLDACGHGVGAALLATSALNVLTAQSLPATDFRDPGQVLKGLNDYFPMEKHNDQYFTIWYGVYDRPGRRLFRAGGGHPAALLYSGPDAQRVRLQQLGCEGPAVGIWPGYAFVTEVCPLDYYARLYLYSDGAFEFTGPNGPAWTYEEFLEFMARLPVGEPAPMDLLLERVKQLRQSPSLADDLSILQVNFDEAAAG